MLLGNYSTSLHSLVCHYKVTVEVLHNMQALLTPRLDDCAFSVAELGF